MSEGENDPDRLRLPAIIYLIGTVLIIVSSYLLPPTLRLAFVVAIAVWGIGVPVSMFLYLRIGRIRP